MSAAKGMWYQSESKLKIPRSSASLVVRPQCAKTRAMTPTVTSQARAFGPAGPVAAGDPPPPPVAKASSGAGPPTAPPAEEAPSPETAKGTVTYEDPSKLQSTVARRMSESKATAPHFYLEAEIDMSRLVAARGQIKSGAKEGDVVPSFNDMVVKACALALREHPRANGGYPAGRFGG